ncbi:hypothetical protein SLA2020_297940 [Shorea laevis]
MISVLAQERLLGAALGSASVGIVVLEQRKRIYNSISDDRSKIATQSKVSGKRFGLEFALLWNKAVDQIFVPAIESLSSRRWQKQWSCNQRWI